ATRADIYAYAVSQVNDIIGQLPPRGPSTYGRATPEAAHMLLAKLYLNAGVYTGTPNFTGAVTEAQAVINAGYSLPASSRNHFTADNNVSPELIFVAAQDGRSTQTWEIGRASCRERSKIVDGNVIVENKDSMSFIG